MESFIQVESTCPNEEEAAKLAQEILTARLGACVHISPIQSRYHWQGEIASDQESKLTIKTRAALYPKLEALILVLHSYDVPQIIATEITGINPTYAAWLEEETTQTKES